MLLERVQRARSAARSVSSADKFVEIGWSDSRKCLTRCARRRRPRIGAANRLVGAERPR